MKSDLDIAREILERDGYTCVLARDGVVHTCQERGVKPLYHWLTEGLDVRGFSAADKVVGRATAFLYCLLGVSAVHSRIMSTAAKEVLQAHGIATSCNEEVGAIINRRGDGPCPFEAAVWEIRDEQQALIAIREKLLAMGLIGKKG